jgi:hypothetical protein
MKMMCKVKVPMLQVHCNLFVEILLHEWQDCRLSYGVMVGEIDDGLEASRR